MNNRFCIDKKIFLLLLILIEIVSVLTISINKQNKKITTSRASTTTLSPESVIQVIYASPKDFLQKVDQINKSNGGSFRLLLTPGLYNLSPSIISAPVTSDKGFGYVGTKVALKISNLKHLEINSTNYFKKIVKPDIYFEGETGLYLSNIENVIIKNINLIGGKVRQYNDPAGIITYEKQIDIGIGPYDALRSQILIEGSSQVTIDNISLEGVALGKDYIPDGAAGVRGITVLGNKSIATKASITDSQFVNNTWDSILLIGNVQGFVSNSNFSRSVQQISDYYIPLGQALYLVKSFAGIDGSGIAALKNSYVEISNVLFEGYHKVMGLNSSQGGKITNVRLHQSNDWNLNDPFMGFWPLWILDGTNNNSKGNLTIKNLFFFDNINPSVEEAKRIPYYSEWLIGLGKLNKVEIDGLRTAYNYFPIEITYPYDINDYIRLPSSNFSIKNWSVALIKRVENGRKYPEFKRKLLHACFVGCKIDNPSFIEYSFPK